MPPDVVTEVIHGVRIKIWSDRPASAGKEQMARTLIALDRELKLVSAKLQNPAFLDRAPQAVVEKTRQRLVELEQRRLASLVVIRTA